jgi:hypothetical protein
MRLFKSNKSQGSLHNISAGKSPLHSPIDSPLQSPAFPPPQSAAYGPGGARYDESTDPSDAQRNYSSDEQQPHFDRSASRAQNQNIPSHGYQGRPIVNVTPDQVDENRPGPLTTVSVTDQEERCQKKLNKRSLFGLHSSKDNTSQTPAPTLPLGNNLPTRKKLAGSESPGGPPSQLTPAQYSGEGYSSDTQEGFTASKEYHTEADEQYYHQPNQFDSPQSQTSSRYSSHYQDEESYQDPQPTSHKPYPPRPSNTSNSYLPYNPQLDRSSLDIHDPYRTIRPPSQQSLGPPSPIVPLQQSNESRPSTVQTRPPNQSSQSSHLQPQAGMARGEASNPSMRQQLAQQHQQGGEQSHGQYGAPQEARQFKHSDHGRSTPPNRNREEYNTQDYTTLLQKHEELRMCLRHFLSLDPRLIVCRDQILQSEEILL